MTFDTDQNRRGLLRLLLGLPVAAVLGVAATAAR